ncbi:LOW QUALITY PROTEIN: hypothetical protein PHMEG_0003051 [Phytophthora megakarya]|uniref:Uncharacterized protein n=1 Tax=Phytophthora megakarya TaxID=4795 RepID=A0A225WXN8_9STRA|nr:LOW QUALITY PROTEIN: hypothetical protein PHMEG_0003051 [Phytophthora megakarya]
MKLSDPKPANTKWGQTTALAAFERYLVSEDTSTAHVEILIVADPATAGAMLVTIMDKFCVHLAFQEGKGEAAVSTLGSAVLLTSQVLAHGSVSTALWPKIQLLKQGHTLEQRCIKRESGGFTKKASQGRS